ncbi:hypothetical protein C8J56DRAFT_899109 [Mycena floridula]|nr:hypothetical protein C8J56DRAFT_899109 [Mycena floridula]
MIYIVAILGGSIFDAYDGLPLMMIMKARFGTQEQTMPEERQKAKERLTNANFRLDESQCKEEAKVVVVANWFGTVPLNVKRKSGKSTRRSAVTLTLSFSLPARKLQIQFIGCPDLVPSFIHTPALWRQIWYLSKVDSQNRNYHLATPRKLATCL